MLGVRLSAETERELDSIARRTRRPKSQLAREAIEAFVRRQNEMLQAEARRQSQHAVERGWNEEDAHWESIMAADDFEAAPPGTRE